MAEPPTAVFFVSDILAIGALLECAERGAAVPAYISVAGFDDLDLASHVRPAHSTVRVPTYEMGRVAALLLLDLIAGQRRRKTRLQTDVHPARIDGGTGRLTDRHRPDLAVLKYSNIKWLVGFVRQIHRR